MPDRDDLITPKGEKILGGALCRKNKRGLYQGSLQAPLASLPLSQIKRAICRAAGLFGETKPNEKFDFIDPNQLRLLVEKYRSDEWLLRVP